MKYISKYWLFCGPLCLLFALIFACCGVKKYPQPPLPEQLSKVEEDVLPAQTPQSQQEANTTKAVQAPKKKTKPVRK